MEPRALAEDGERGMIKHVADELREWIAGNTIPGERTDKELRKIADQIDDECYKRMIHADEFSKTCDMIQLPVDAKGVPWFVGDVAGVNGKPCTISCIRLKRDGWSMMGNLKDGRTWKCDDPSKALHYKLTQAGRVRRIANEINRWKEPNNGYYFYSIGDVVNALNRIADDLEGGSE